MPVKYDETLREYDRRMHEGKPAIPSALGIDDVLTCIKYVLIGPYCGVNREMYEKAHARLSDAQRAEVDRMVNR